MLNSKPNFNLSFLHERNLFELCNPKKYRPTNQKQCYVKDKVPKFEHTKKRKRYSINLNDYGIKYVGTGSRGKMPYKPYPGTYTDWLKRGLIK